MAVDQICIRSRRAPKADATPARQIYAELDDPVVNILGGDGEARHECVEGDGVCVLAFDLTCAWFLSCPDNPTWNSSPPGDEAERAIPDVTRARSATEAKQGCMLTWRSSGKRRAVLRC